VVRLVRCAAAVCKWTVAIKNIPTYSKWGFLFLLVQTLN
jgi:hypothetical protein